MDYAEAPLNVKLFAVKDVSYYCFLTEMTPVIHTGELRKSSNFWSGKGFSPYNKDGSLSKAEWNSGQYHYFTDWTAAKAYAYAQRLRFVERAEQEVRNTFPEFQD